MMKVVYTASLSLTLGTPFMWFIMQTPGWLSLRISNQLAVCVYLASCLFSLLWIFLVSAMRHKDPWIFVYFHWKMFIFFFKSLFSKFYSFPDSWPTNRYLSLPRIYLSPFTSNWWPRASALLRWEDFFSIHIWGHSCDNRLLTNINVFSYSSSTVPRIWTMLYPHLGIRNSHHVINVSWSRDVGAKKLDQLVLWSASF